MKWITGSGPHSCWLGINEVRKRRLFAQSVKAGDVVYDIGANVGSYTMLASVLTGPTGHVYAFEPLPENLSYLREHVELNRLRNVTVVGAAVADRVGEVRFHGTVDRVTSHISQDGEYLVPATTLDSFLADGNIPPSCLKIDVEGSEISVFEGARGTITSHSPIIFVATHGDEAAEFCWDFLQRLGYSVASVPGHQDELIGRCNR